MYNSTFKSAVVIFLSFRKNKETKCVSVQISRTAKGLSFHCQKFVWRSGTLQKPSKSIIKKDGISIRFSIIFTWNFEKWKRQKLKNSIFNGSFIVNQAFTNKMNILLTNQNLAFSLNQTSNICEIWKY